MTYTRPDLLVRRKCRHDVLPSITTTEIEKEDGLR